MTETAKSIYKQIVELENRRNELSTTVTATDHSKDAEFYKLDCEIADLRDKFKAEVAVDHA